MMLVALPSAFGSDTPGVLALCMAMVIALFWYIFFSSAEVSESTEKTRLAYLRERKDAVYENLRDLNFEYKAGKFPEADFQQMRTSLEEEAAALLAEIENLESDRSRPDAGDKATAGHLKGTRA